MDSPRGKPPADFEVDAECARALLRAQLPELAALPLTALGSGWDNVMFRLGPHHVMRLPRRVPAVPLIQHEQRWLPQLQGSLPLKVPAPTHAGVPGAGFPWPWSVSQWIEGETADLQPPDAAQGALLAAFLQALHQPAPADAPHNVYRGVPLQERAANFEQYAARIQSTVRDLDERHRSLWQRALAAPLDMPPTWIHGDLHPRNVLIEGGRIAGVIDWGDMARGDRATDLAAIWLLLPQHQSRCDAMARLEAVSGPTWERARGWALLFAAILLNAGLAADARMRLIGERALRHLHEGP